MRKIVISLIILQIIIVAVLYGVCNNFQKNVIALDRMDSLSNVSRNIRDFTLDPAWTSIGDNQDHAYYGNSIACAGDVNNDGYMDIIIGCYGYDTVNKNAGKAYLYLGGSNGLNTTPIWTSHGDDQDKAFYGCSIACAGDVNNDGYDDVIIGASCFNTTNYRAGKAYLYLSGSNGLNTTPIWTSHGNDQYDARFGNQVAGAGDVNNDGYDDVIISAPHYDTTEPDAGKIYLYLGSKSGLELIPKWTSTGNNPSGTIYGEGYGSSIASAGDVNGDDYDDIIIGACIWPSISDGYIGKAYLYLGNSNGLNDAPAWTSSGDTQLKAQFGFPVASAGDVNNDGYDDVIIGSYLCNAKNSNAGKAYLYLGSSEGLQNLPVWTSSGDDQKGLYYGIGVGGAGDINNDNYDDIIVGANKYCTNNFQAGKAYLYLGSEGGPSPIPIWISVGDNKEKAWFGYPANSAGDVNGDGYNDFMLGATHYNTENEMAGKVFLYHGGIPPILPPSLINATVVPNSSDNEDSYEYKVTYIDPNNIPGPHEIKIIIDYDSSSPIEKDMILESGHNTSGAVYIAQGIQLSIGQHNFKINATNGKYYAEELFGNGPEVVKANHAPFWDESNGIKDKIELQEDSGNFYFDLNRAFTDPDNDILDFTIFNSYYKNWKNQTENNLFAAKILNSNKSIEIVSRQDMFGYGNIYVRATDPEGLFCEHIINITILSINDAPVLNNISHWLIENNSCVEFSSDNVIIGKQDHWLNLTINVTDIDSENFTYKAEIMNSDRPPPNNFVVDSEYGKITFLPTNDDVGIIYMNITVEDDGIPKGNDFLTVTFEIENTNDPPKIISVDQIQSGLEYNVSQGMVNITNGQTPIQNEWFNLSVNVVDIDMNTPIGEKFRFYTDISEQIPELIEDSNFKFDIKTGNLSIKPTNNMTNRVYFIKLVVLDNNGYYGCLNDSVILKIKIRNLNDPPNTPIILMPLYPYIFNTTDKINFKAFCNDPDQYVPDSNETLTYFWESNIIGKLNGDEIDNGRELNNIIISEPGLHLITLTVTDSDGLSSNTSFIIEIVKPSEKENGNEGIGIEIWLTLLIILIIIVIFLYLKNVKKKPS